MKKLQCNFTTIEQSKRLLELGVPAWTADCFYPLNLSGNLSGDTPIIILFNLDVKEIVWDKIYAIPCWSVGRLIEIISICKISISDIFNDVVNWITFCEEQPPLQTVYDELCAGITQCIIDFSKLEE